MNKQGQSNSTFKPGIRNTIETRTTIFDLIEILSEVVEKGEEKFIPQIVSHMADSGLLKAVK